MKLCSTSIKQIQKDTYWQARHNLSAQSQSIQLKCEKKKAQNNQDVWSMILTTGICTYVRKSLYVKLYGQMTTESDS